jgi:hypothetical protein
MARTLKIGDCTYCGKHGPLTDDHIPPQSLFPTGIPNHIKIPSCSTCNGGASKDDEYFRSVLAIRSDVGDASEAKKATSRLMRSLQKPEKKGFKTSFMKAVRMRELFTPGGLYLGRHGTYSVDLNRVAKVIARIVKGLFFHTFQRRLPDTYEAIGFEESGLAQRGELNAESLRILNALSDVDFVVMGDGVFTYRVKVAVDGPNVTVWQIVFYKKASFFGMTAPK